MNAMEPGNRPRHVLVIPDGNRRWAKQRGKPGYEGHREGAKVFEKVLDTALRLHIPAITIWGASRENIEKRTPREVRALFAVFKAYFGKLSRSAHVKKAGVRVEVLGKWREFFPTPVQAAIDTCILATKAHSAHTLTFLLAYNGKDEMLNAIGEIVRKKVPVNEENLKRHLWTKNLPPVDLVIRTGGEPHLSTGVMMWDIADARFYFTETLWPDFSEGEFKKAIEEYAKAGRRFGG